MAAVNVGTKRSYQQMQDLELDIETSATSTAQIVQSRPYSQADSRATTPLNGEFGTKASSGLLRKAEFESSASIVLLGIRGVGKSTLGVLAATAYNRRLIDSERIFLEVTGSTGAAYRKLHGSNEYQRRHSQVLENTLNTYSNNAVIVCSFSDLEKDGSTLLREYSRTHPVIHVIRDPESIQAHIKVWTIDRIKELLKAGGALLRHCSNFEFFNLSEHGENHPDGHSNHASNSEGTREKSSGSSFLTLKRAERDFLRLLRNIVGDHNRGLSHQSAYPLSQVKIEDRKHTFSVSVHVSEINTNQLDLDEVQIGADCVELLVDINDSNSPTLLNDVAKAFAIVRRATILPILVTPRIVGRAAQKTWKQSFELTKQSLRLGPELCSIDLSIEKPHLKQLIACQGTSLIGVSEFSTRPSMGWNDKQCFEAYQRAADINCHFAKVTMPGRSTDDIFAIHSFEQTISELRLQPRLIAYVTGAKGRVSRLFNRILTPVERSLKSPETNRDHETEETSVNAKAITQAMFSSFMLQPLSFFIFGADVSHSLSPAMHNAAYLACGMQYNCTTLSSDKLDDFKTLAKGTQFGGTAVAHPFKTAVAAIVDGKSRHASIIGAVNTVVPVRELAPDGSIPDEAAIIAQTRERGPVKALYGFNTDWIGIRACVRQGLSPANTIRPQTSALVCGAGGMARSAIYTLISLGVQNIFVYNRTLSNAVALAEYYNDLVNSESLGELISDKASQIRVQVLETFESPWPSDVRQPTIVVNCVPRLDANDSAISISLPEAWLKSPTGGVVVEVAYRLPVSPLVKQIRKLAHIGWIVMDGFDVLPEQAYSQFELFTGRRAPRKLMREEILKHYPFDAEE